MWNLECDKSNHATQLGKSIETNELVQLYAYLNPSINAKNRKIYNKSLFD